MLTLIVAHGILGYVKRFSRMLIVRDLRNVPPNRGFDIYGHIDVIGSLWLYAWVMSRLVKRFATADCAVNAMSDLRSASGTFGNSVAER